jgi:flavin-dependent dehydrogenase
MARYLTAVGPVFVGTIDYGVLARACLTGTSQGIFMTIATENPSPAICDVLVIGGGPGGSTTASLLAERGYRVVMLEKSRHPRFHIGESLLPANLPILERLGVADKIRAIGMEKWGAEFVSPADGRRHEFQFADSWDKSLGLAYQVRRSEFDEILFRRAADLGCHVIEGCRVREVKFLQDAATRERCVRVDAEHEGGGSESWLAGTVVDASGRDTFLGNRLRSKQRNRKHNSAAMFAHFTGARRDCGKRAGNITIFWFDHGWFWFIPLADGTTSIGAVAWPYYMQTRATSVRDFFLQTIELCPPLAERLCAATLSSDVEATGNYSYACDRSHGANYLLVGDAYTFVDPVFSSGVMLAMNSGVAAAETIHACRTQPARAKAALRRFERISRHGPKQFSWFIYRVSNPLMRELFLGPRNVLRMEEALLSVLAGDIFGRTPIWGRLRLFKALYYTLSFAYLGRSLRAWRRRAANIRPAPEQMTSG